jgi:prolyl oligopeptidase
MYDALDAYYECVGTLGQELLLLTSKEAPRQRIVAAHPERPEKMRTIVPEGDDVISEASVAGGQIIVTAMRDARDVVVRYSLDGNELGPVDLPGIGSCAGAAARALPEHTRVFIPYSSFLTPRMILEYDVDTDSLKPFFTPEVTGFDPERYETRQIFATSKDGTSVPVFVTCRTDITLSGVHPTILYGYGGFDVNIKPGYASWLPVWLEEGGVFASAVLRGGGEYGDEWHNAGMFEKKQNVFDDFVAAAQGLIREGYCTSRRLAAEGGSNGGLLVSATMLQHPSLFGAALCHVPVADMLRYQHFTAGRYWTSEFGDAEKDQESFEALYSYSPVHNVKEGQSYPPILIMSADHDDRVVPMHSKKLAARLQAANPDNVVLLRIETKAGHGAGKPLTKQIELRADVLAFLKATIE